MTNPFKRRLIFDIVTGLSTALFYANSIADERGEKNCGQKRNGEREREEDRMGGERGTRKW